MAYEEMGAGLQLRTDSLCFKFTRAGGHKFLGDALDAGIKMEGGAQHVGIVSPTNPFLAIFGTDYCFALLYVLYAGLAFFGC